MKLLTYKAILSLSTLCMLVGFAIDSNAQSLEDAIRYSLYNSSSTARSVGVAGALGPLGADLSIANINPAGIAEFRRSEWTISLGVGLNSNETSFSGNQESQSKTEVQLDNLAAVFAYDPPSFNIKSFNLAIGVNKLADFTNKFSYSGTSSGTVVERFLERAEGLSPDELDDFEGGLAFDAGAIFSLNGSTSYDTDFATLDERVFRTEDVERSGSFQEVFIVTATNIKNKFSIGFTLGIPIIRYEESKTYREIDQEGNVDLFDELEYRQALVTTGAGVNFKLGIIYKITPKTRFGAAIHSPSYLFLADEFTSDLDYSITSSTSESFSAQSPFGTFDYQLATPWRASAGLGHIFKVGNILGFVTGEVEYVDYKSANFNLTADSNNPLDQFFENELNGQTDSDLASALNIRVGTELAYKKFRVRLGAGLYSDPYTDSTQDSFDPRYNIGIGFRADRRYIDLAFSTIKNTQRYSPYNLINQEFEQDITAGLTRNRVSLTVGSKF